MSARAQHPAGEPRAVQAHAGARRRRRAAWVDAALGALVAALALVLGPGLGVVAVAALALIALCALAPVLRRTRAWGGRAVSRWR